MTGTVEYAAVLQAPPTKSPVLRWANASAAPVIPERLTIQQLQLIYLLGCSHGLGPQGKLHRARRIRQVKKSPKFAAPAGHESGDQKHVNQTSHRLGGRKRRPIIRLVITVLDHRVGEQSDLSDPQRA
jgi:hypothetical protein